MDMVFYFTYVYFLFIFLSFFISTNFWSDCAMIFAGY